jgi:PAS domain S-box-containing protein
MLETDWQAIPDALDVGVIVVDAAGRIVVWNDWIARATKLPSTRVVGTRLEDHFPDVAKTRVPAAIAEAFEFGSSSVLTYSLNKLLPLKADDDTSILHNLVVRPLAADGEKHCLLQITDVTVAVTRERVLRERQNARYHAIVGAVPDAIITTSEDVTIQWMNGAVERVFGYAPSELLGQKLDVLAANPDDMALLFSSLAKEVHSTATTQIMGRDKAGRTAFFEVSLGRWNADEREFVTTVWRDVTDKVKARNALQRSNEELEAIVVERTREREAALNQLHESQKMETIGQLTGGVAHDFNNLLAVILGSLSLLKKILPDDPRTSRLLEGAIQGAERGATLTKRLLAFARRQELRLQAVEVQKLIPDMLDFLRQSIGPGIKIILDIPDDVPPVKIDANQLELAIMNLAVNSRDAMPNGGALTISCRPENGTGHPMPATLAPGDYVRVSVADTGEGMDAATLAKAMEPFFTTKGVGKGTGLGLSMVHGLAAQCGGVVKIVSQPDRGTMVTLWLPHARLEDLVELPSDRPVQPADIARRKLKILLVDDDPLVSRNTIYMLADLDHAVIAASSGKQALKLLGPDHDFDLVLTDYAMPEMNGLDLAKRIRELHPRLPIILATGFADIHPLQTDSFPKLSKPYSQDQLAEILEKASAGMMRQH